jgi:gliding motility-associated-like protein
LDTVVEVNTEVKLKASPGSNYQWSPTLWLSCKDCSSPTSIPKDSITYIVSFIDMNGCKRDEIFKVKVTQEEPELPERPDPTIPGEPEKFFIPNVFTPNNDGKNDVFEIVGLTPKSRLIIVNRWGKVVFESNDYKNEWSGDSQASGPYYYLLIYSKNGLKYNGWVEIVR